MLDKVIKFFAGFFGLMLLLVGLWWVVDPASAAAMLEMELLVGKGRSTQVGDMTAFFVVAGSFALLGLFTRNRSMLYASAALLGFAAVFRTLAWQAHGADLMLETIIQEVLMFIAFTLAGRRMAAA